MNRILGLAPFVALWVTASAQIDLTQTVMVVNGEEIKAAEYYRRMEFLQGVGKAMGNRIATAPPGFLTLQRLLDERLMLQLAAQRGVLPTDKDVQAELASRLKEDPKLLESWLADGLTEPELMYQIKLDLTQFRLQTQGITITDQEVQKFYQDNPEMFTTPKRYKLRLIAVANEEDKKKVDDALASGAAFADVAKAHSIDASKVAGGDLPPLPESSLGDSLKKALAAIRVGQVTEWVSTPNGHWKFLLESVLPEERQPLDDKCKKQIRTELMLERGRQKIDLNKDLMQARSKARVEVRKKGFEKAFAEYMKNSAASAGGG